MTKYVWYTPTNDRAIRVHLKNGIKHLGHPVLSKCSPGRLCLNVGSTQVYIHGSLIQRVDNLFPVEAPKNDPERSPLH
jgi:hypothetical protein